MNLLLLKISPDSLVNVIDICADLFENLTQIDSVATVIKLNTRNVKELHIKLKDYLYPQNIDYLIYPDVPKKLLLCDMDKTLLDMETFDTVAEKFNPKLKDEISRLNIEASKTTDILAISIAKLKLFRGVTVDTIEDILKNEVVLMSGAKELAMSAKKHNLYRVISSGGYSQFASYLAELLDFNKYYSNVAEIIYGKLTGNSIGEILSEKSKKEHLEFEIERLGIKIDETVAIGDGTNDILMLSAAGLGIAFHAKELVRKNIDNQINFNDLSVVSYTF